MSYSYQAMKPQVFEEDNQETFLKVRDNVDRLTKLAGCVRMGEAIAGCTGDSWVMMACMDRLVEIGEIVEIRNNVSSMGQHRLFVRKPQ